MLKLFVIAAMLASTNLHAESKKIIKWVDKNGVTQYGDRLPMPSKAKKASVLSKQGITVKTIEHKGPTTEQDKALSMQTRRDNALLASFNSIEEIDIARTRNTKIDKLALDALEKKHERLNNTLAKNNKILLIFAKKKKPAPADTTNAIEQNMADIAKLEQKIHAKNITIEKIQQRFDNDKIRYAQLDSKRATLNTIQYNKKNIAELKTWQAGVQKRYNFYQNESLRYKRAGNRTPKHIAAGLLSTSRELKRANQEIDNNKLAIRKNKEQVSRSIKN